MKAENILVRVPNWVGDCVMATPALMRLRRHFDRSRITLAATNYVRQVVEDGPWADAIIEVPRERNLRALSAAVKLLAAGRFDLAVLLTNSLGSALAARLAGIGRIVGYSREGRGWLLTDKLKAPKENGRFVPAPMVGYYNRLADYLGCSPGESGMTLYTSPAWEQKAEELFGQLGIDPSKPVAGINPGAAFGSAKCWPLESFAAVANALSERMGMRVVVLCGPKEREIADQIAVLAGGGAVSLGRFDVPLGLLKAIVRRLSLMVTNDSGPRHFAASFGVPVVTIIGPTNPEWSDTGYEKGIQLQAKIDCGPCMLRRCPSDHRCMKEITPEMVIEAAERLLGACERRFK